MGSKIHKHHHHILPVKTALAVGATLLFLTAVTVWVAHIDLGRLNFVIAMAVATVKALLVALIFMNLKYDRAENGMIFVTSFLFLAIFIVLTSTDLFFRGDVYVKGPLMAASQGPSKYKKPWISTPELIAHGKELFSVQCVACHGVNGQGDGPAASALTPHPRNFHLAAGWVNGRKPTMVFKTLKEGVPGSAMASFATLPADDRWALAQYVLSLGPTPPEKDTAADFAKLGIDPTKEGGGGTEAPTVPIYFAIQRVTVPESPAEANAQLFHPASAQSTVERGAGGRIYQQYCLECHGDRGQGSIKVRSLGVNPSAYVTTSPFKSQTGSLQSADAFGKLVVRGIPDFIMPGVGNTQLERNERLVPICEGSRSESLAANHSV